MAGSRCHEPGCVKNAQLVGMCIEHGDVPRVLEPCEGYMTHGEIAVQIRGMADRAPGASEDETRMQTAGAHPRGFFRKLTGGTNGI